MSANLSRKVFSGLKWTTSSTVVNVLMQTAYTSIIARLLPPAAFGLVALAMVLLRFGTYLADMGLSQAVIQKKNLSKFEIRASFTATFLLGVLCFLLIYWLAPLIAYLYDSKGLSDIMRVMALSFVFTGAYSTSRSLLRREMNFKALSYVAIFSYGIAYLIIGIGLAWMGFGIWSLVYAAVGQSAISAVMCLYFAPHSMLFTFRWEYYRHLFNYGTKRSANSVLEFIGLELDTLILGKIASSTVLGYYNRAIFLIRLPMGYLTQSVSTVLFPALSSIQTEVYRLQKAFLTSISYTTFFIYSVCVGVSISAEQIVWVLLGDQWLEAIPALRILAISALFNVSVQFSGIFIDATARLKQKFIVQLAILAILATLLYLLSPLGLVGFAWAVLISQLVKNIAFIFILRPVLKFSWASVLGVYWQGVYSVGITGSIIYLLYFSMSALGLPHWVILVGEVAGGGLGLIIVFWLAPTRYSNNWYLTNWERAFSSRNTQVFPQKQILKIIQLIRAIDPRLRAVKES
ncbi:MAG: lipopolysaccharide biosynthesis protein [Bacteroidia bacterium]|nr:lipopolysaccharide biosynthesis protein [Bacteroidia bacterium]